MWIWFLTIGVLGLLLFAGWWLRQRARPSAEALEQQLALCLKGLGPGRCEGAIELLDGLARRGDPELVIAMWQQLEIPLLEALPDCPPHRKSELMRALERCHTLVRRRDLQRRLIDMRNALASGTDEYVVEQSG